jgi:hypothetical protein
MKNKTKQKYNIVGTLPKSNREIVAPEAKSIPQHTYI